MTSLTSFIAAPAAFTSRLQRPVRHPRLQRCYAAEEKRGLDFSPNKNTNLGYTESDSAGQTNIFAVEPKQYMAGGKTDAAVAAGNSTVATASVAGAVAAGAVLAGLVLVQQSTSDLASVAPTGDFVTLSQYSAQFKAELATAPAAAPALIE